MSNLKKVIKVTEAQFGILVSGGTVGGSGYSDDVLYAVEHDFQSDWTETDNTKDSFIKNKPTLATVATSGSYNDLDDKPTIPSQYVHPHPTRTNTTSAITPSHGDSFTVIDSIVSNTEGHITSVNTKTVTLPSGVVIGKATKSGRTDGLTVSVTTQNGGVSSVSFTGTVNSAITANSAMTANNATNATYATNLGDTNNHYTYSDINTELVDIREVAEGKKATYVTSAAAFQTQASAITISGSFVDANNRTIYVSGLTLGDNVYVTQVDVPDRWVAQTGSSSVVLYALETAKVHVANVNYSDGSSAVQNNVATIGHVYNSTIKSVAENDTNSATLSYAHAEGEGTTASGYRAHSEGYNTVASHNQAHAEGQSTRAEGQSSHAEGYFSKSQGEYSHAEGVQTIASGYTSHSEGYNTVVIGANGSHAEGLCWHGVLEYLPNISQSTSFDDIYGAWSGLDANHAFTLAFGNDGAHAEGKSTIAYGLASHSEGVHTCSRGYGSHSEGYNTYAKAHYSHAEGGVCTTSGYYSHAEGNTTKTEGEASHAEGIQTYAVGHYSHIEGASYVKCPYVYDPDGTSIQTILTNWNNAETKFSVAFGYAGHVEGSCSLALGPNSHAQGQMTRAIGNNSSANGYYTQSIGNNSHADGEGTIASAQSQCVIGKWNVPDTNSLFIVGRGWDESNRYNAFSVDLDGKAYAPNGFYQTSDERKKDIISNISLRKCEQLLKKCQFINYTWKDDEEKKVQLGMLAQEVLPIFPEIVSGDDESGYSLDYARLSVIALRLIEKQNDRLKKIEARLKKLEENI